MSYITSLWFTVRSRLRATEYVLGGVLPALYGRLIVCFLHARDVLLALLSRYCGKEQFGFRAVRGRSMLRTSPESVPSFSGV